MAALTRFRFAIRRPNHSRVECTEGVRLRRRGSHGKLIVITIQDQHSRINLSRTDHELKRSMQSLLMKSHPAEFNSVARVQCLFRISIQSPSPAFDKPKSDGIETPHGKQCDSIRHAGRHAPAKRATTITWRRETFHYCQQPCYRRSGALACSPIPAATRVCPQVLDGVGHLQKSSRCRN